MAEVDITERQQCLLDQIKLAYASEGTLVEYAKVYNLKVKDVYRRAGVGRKRKRRPGCSKLTINIPITNGM